MIKMILADDEPVISRGIQKLIDWNSLGVEIVGIYEDGKSAFEGILCNKPDLALLDISMPGMTGIDILKECSSMNLKTKIIFISGFQDFEYAKDALKYGAVEYLLKPVIREELVSALEKCILDNEIRIRNQASHEEWQKETDYSRLIQLENASYIPVYAEVLYKESVTEQGKRLIQFSFSSFLEEYLEEKKNGITFNKNNRAILVLKKLAGMEPHDVLEDITERFGDMTGQKVFFVIGPCVEHMSEIPAAYEKCLKKVGYTFFAEELSSNIIETEKPVFAGRVELEWFERVRHDIINSITSQDGAAFENYYEQLVKLVCRMAEGKKEDACFHFCSVVRLVEEKMHALQIRTKNVDMRELLEQARSAYNYRQLAEIFRNIFVEYLHVIQTIASNSEMQNLLKAKEFIESHYQENLTLQVLADHIHMNSYYFSAFFKKNAGENFKDYVSRVSLEHAIPLLISSNKKTYEIAIEVGFSDARTFTDAFQKFYKETPSSYRKRIRGEKE